MDLSEIKIEPPRIHRFERDFFSLKAENVSQELLGLEKKYPEFTLVFIRNILCPSGLEDSACIPGIIKFISDKDMRAAYDQCQQAFPDLKETESSLNDLMRHYYYYFPERKRPEVYAMMSGFNYALASVEGDFAVGLEMYLGEKTKFYEMMNIPSYKRMTMRKEYIVPHLLQAWMMREFPKDKKSMNLLSEMIYQGKLLYLADAMMPRVHDTLKIGFTGRQLAWCIDHEKDMWGHLLQNKFLYSNESDIIVRFTGEGPFTTGFVKESPARTGVWIGWQIVRSYMEEYPTTTLEQLMSETDAQMIVSKSKYKP